MSSAQAGRADRRWADHLLRSEDPNVVQTVVNFASRLEFQDGSRKRGTQKYHGRGTVHSHSLDYMVNTKAAALETKISATVPPETEPLLRGLVLDSQLDWSRSNWPIREEPSMWGEESERVLLHHSAEDSDLHVRAYVPETMEVTKCHEDLQQGHGNATEAWCQRKEVDVVMGRHRRARPGVISDMS